MGGTMPDLSLTDLVQNRTMSSEMDRYTPTR